MSEQTIYNALRAGGLSAAGACAMMGNMFCESGLRSDNVQDNCPMGDSDYTWNVDNGQLSKWQFMTDSYGYGLCQWTYHTRKEELYLFARESGTSIGDEQMQCRFCLLELQKYYAGLYSYLCTTEDLPKATERICAEFEQPAVNNFAARINAAQRYFNCLADIPVTQPAEPECSEDACPIVFQEADLCTVTVRALKRGDLGRDVFLLQAGMTDMRIDCGVPDGDFGSVTEEAVRELQRAKNITPTGIADASVWSIILKER